MTLRVIEGFDHHGGSIAGVDVAGWTRAGTFQSGSALNSPGRWGVGRYLYQVGQDCWSQRRLAVGYPEMWFGFAIAGQIRATNNWIYIQSANGATLGYIGRDASGFLQLKNLSGTVLYTSPYQWDGGWHYMEIRILSAGAAGTGEVWVDGVQVIPSTVGNFGTGLVNSCPAGLLFYNYDNGGGNWWTTYIDDLYMLDTGTGVKNTRLGECRVETIYPTADGAHVDFTPTTPTTHFDEVDDGAAGNDGDTTNVQTNVVGARDSYAFGDLSIASGTIHGVAVRTVARKNDAGPRAIKHLIRQGGVTYEGSVAHLLTASHFSYQTVFDQDPLNANWSVANVNADEYGVKVES